jgi:hypothetical protein
LGGPPAATANGRFCASLCLRRCRSAAFPARRDGGSAAQASTRAGASCRCGSSPGPRADLQDADVVAAREDSRVAEALSDRLAEPHGGRCQQRGAVERGRDGGAAAATQERVEAGDAAERDNVHRVEDQQLLHTRDGARAHLRAPARSGPARAAVRTRVGGTQCVWFRPHGHLRPGPSLGLSERFHRVVQD